MKQQAYTAPGVPAPKGPEKEKDKPQKVGPTLRDFDKKRAPERATPEEVDSPGVQKERNRTENPQRGSWLAPSTNRWTTAGAELPTRDSVLEGIAANILDRYFAEADMAQGGTVDKSWVDNQVSMYSDITEEDIRRAVVKSFELNGVKVR